MESVDLIIIGCGPGGYKTALAAVKAGLSVVIIDAGKVGGTCLNKGCIPTKTLCRNAEILNILKDAGSYGIEDLHYRFDYEKAWKRKNEVVDALRTDLESLMVSSGIRVVTGRASFRDEHTIEVIRAHNLSGKEVETVYTARNIIIATGSRPAIPDIPGVDLPGVITSDGLLDMDVVPPRLCIIGGGIIGLEFASLFCSFGSKVTVVEYLKEILSPFDTDMAKRLRQLLSRRGVTFFLQSEVHSIVQDKADCVVKFVRKEEEEEVHADNVLLATGRTPVFRPEELDAIDVEYDKKGILTDDNMRTSIPHIYAVGDVTGKCNLAHLATFQGYRALNDILGQTDTIRLDIVPAAVYTDPEMAMVGLTEKDCRDRDITYTCKKTFFRANGKAVAMNCTEGLVKLLADENGIILGCQILGVHASDLIQEISVIICQNETVDGLKSIIHGHPTLGEVLFSASELF